MFLVKKRSIQNCSFLEAFLYKTYQNCNTKENEKMLIKGEVCGTSFVPWFDMKMKKNSVKLKFLFSNKKLFQTDDYFFHIGHKL